MLRFSLYFLLPMAARRAAGRYDLGFTCDRVDLSLLGGDAGIWNVQLAPRRVAAEAQGIRVTVTDVAHRSYRGRRPLQRVPVVAIPAWEGIVRVRLGGDDPFLDENGAQPQVVGHPGQGRRLAAEEDGDGDDRENDGSERSHFSSRQSGIDERYPL